MKLQRSNFSKTIVGKGLEGSGKLGQVASKVIQGIGTVLKLFKRSPQKKEAIRLAKRQGLRGSERRSFIRQYLQKTGTQPTRGQRAETIANEISQAFMSPQNENVNVTAAALTSGGIGSKPSNNMMLWVIGAVALALGTGIIKLK